MKGNHALLRSMRLFRGLTSGEVDLIAQSLTLRKCRRNRTVIDEGDGSGGALFLVKSGQLKVSHVVRGKSRILGTFRAGDHFGEIAFIDRRPRSATIFAAENSELLVFERKTYEHLVASHPQLRIKLMENLMLDLCDKLRTRVSALDFDLSDLLPLCVLESDRKGVVTFSNRNGLELIGYSHKDFERGMNLFHILTPEDRARKILRKAMSGASIGPVELDLIKRDKKLLPILLQADPLRTGTKTTGLRATLIDITERRKAEAILRESEARYRIMAETAHDAILTIDQGSKIILVNPAAQKIFGYKAGQMLGKSLTMLMPSDSRKKHSSSLKRYLRSGEKNISREAVEVSAVHRSGRMIPLEVSFGEYVKDGRHYFTGIMRDITERRRSDEAIRTLQKAVETMKIGVSISDINGTIIYTNPAEARMHGYGVHELLGKNVRIFAPRDLWRPMSMEELRRITNRVRESVNIRKDRTTFPVQVISNVVMDEAGDPIAVVTSCEDITERKRVEAALRRAHDELEIRVKERTFELLQTNARLREVIEEQKQAEEENRQLAEQLRKAQLMEAMGRLVSGVAHEVRNPLNALQATTDALQQELGTNNDYKPFLDVIHGQVGRLSALMRELLELGRPVDAARMHPHFLGELCDVAVQLWRQTSRNETHMIEVARERSPLQVHVDDARIQQVIVNLLDNAVEHSPAGSTIRVTIGLRSGQAVLSIQDQGVGVDPEIIPRLFEPFFTTRRGGTGLGLSLVKHFVESHGGKVALCNSQPPPGCTVEVLLPLSS